VADLLTELYVSAGYYYGLLDLYIGLLKIQQTFSKKTGTRAYCIEPSLHQLAYIIYLQPQPSSSRSPASTRIFTRPQSELLSDIIVSYVTHVILTDTAKITGT